MTPEQQQDANEADEIANKAYETGNELLHLIEVLERYNKDIQPKIEITDAKYAGAVVYNGLLSRIVLIVAGAYSPARDGDLHLRRAFELLKQPEVRDELGRRGSSEMLEKAIALWERYQTDPRREPIMHFRHKFTAHLAKPKGDIAGLNYETIFSFARDTVTIMDALGRGAGPRREPLRAWEEAAKNAAERFWSPWKDIRKVCGFEILLRRARP